MFHTKNENKVITNIDKNSSSHLTARNKKTISILLENKMMKGGTKLIQYELTHISGDRYSVKIYERYALASRSFDLRPESQIVKWHFTGKAEFNYKK